MLTSKIKLRTSNKNSQAIYVKEKLKETIVDSFFVNISKNNDKVSYLRQNLVKNLDMLASYSLSEIHLKGKAYPQKLQSCLLEIIKNLPHYELIKDPHQIQEALANELELAYRGYKRTNNIEESSFFTLFTAYPAISLTKGLSFDYAIQTVKVRIVSNIYFQSRELYPERTEKRIDIETSKLEIEQQQSLYDDIRKEVLNNLEILSSYDKDEEKAKSYPKSLQIAISCLIKSKTGYSTIKGNPEKLKLAFKEELDNIVNEFNLTPCKVINTEENPDNIVTETKTTILYKKNLSYNFAINNLLSNELNDNVYGFKFVDPKDGAKLPDDIIFTILQVPRNSRERNDKINNYFIFDLKGYTAYRGIVSFNPSSIFLDKPETQKFFKYLASKECRIEQLEEQSVTYEDYNFLYAIGKNMSLRKIAPITFYTANSIEVEKYRKALQYVRESSTFKVVTKRIGDGHHHIVNFEYNEIFFIQK